MSKQGISRGNSKRTLKETLMGTSRSLQEGHQCLVGLRGGPGGGPKRELGGNFKGDYFISLELDREIFYGTLCT